MPPTLVIDGKPTFLLGVNYWSRGGGPRMWERFDASRVRAELAQMRGIGLNVCRSFAFNPSFMPTPPAVDPGALQRLSEFFSLCSAERMHAIPTVLVGHMSGENYDFPQQRGRSPYSDPEVLGWQQQLARAIAGAGRESPAIIAYLASNEMPLWGGRSTPPVVSAWAMALRQALHEADAARPFGIGDGVMNLKGGQNGFDVEALRPAIDFVGPHTYYADSDSQRQALNAEFCLRSLTYLGLPVLFEEFGCSSTQVSEQNQRLYYREVIHACLSVGAAGALGWCFSDFDLVDEAPYSHHAFELGFGITRSDGSEKPVCDELRAITRLTDGLDFTTLRAPQPQAAIVVPSYFNTTYPFSWEDRDRMRRTLLQCYVLCVKAGLEVELVPETADLSRYRLLLLPSTQKLLAPTWRFLLDHVRQGNVVYWSYFAGDYNFHQGAWCAGFEELTGCVHQLRYACFDLPPARFLLRGAGLDLDVSTEVGSRPYPRAFLPVDPVAAVGTEVLAHDGEGRPALTRARHGAGRLLFCTHPLEYYLAEQADINERDGSEQLYRLLTAEAGLEPPIGCDQPLVQTRRLEDGEGALLWVLNHGWGAVHATIDSPGGHALYGTASALREGASELELQPKQVAVFRLGRGDVGS